MFKDDSDCLPNDSENPKLFMFGDEVKDGIRLMLWEAAKKLQSADPDPDCSYEPQELTVPRSFDDLGFDMKDGPIRTLVTANIVRFKREGDAIFGYGRDRDFLVELTTEDSNTGPFVRATVLNHSALILVPTKPKKQCESVSPFRGDLISNDEDF